MWCVTIGSHQQQKILIKVQDEEKKLKLSFRGWETTVIMSQELGKHMLVCCCWNRGASLRLRFGNMKGFVGWAGGLALIQGLIAREAGSKLRLWDREKNLVTYSSKDRSSKQTEATGCWANHSVHIRTPFLAAALGRGGGTLSHLTEPQRKLRRSNVENRNVLGQAQSWTWSSAVLLWSSPMQGSGCWQQTLLFGLSVWKTKLPLCCFIATN